MEEKTKHRTMGWGQVIAWVLGLWFVGGMISSCQGEESTYYEREAEIQDWQSEGEAETTFSEEWGEVNDSGIDSGVELGG